MNTDNSATNTILPVTTDTLREMIKDLEAEVRIAQLMETLNLKAVQGDTATTTDERQVHFGKYVVYSAYRQTFEGLIYRWAMRLELAEDQD